MDRTVRISGPGRGKEREKDMRVMLKAQMNAEAGNQAVESGALGRVLQELNEVVDVEAAYFGPQDGKRTAMLFFEVNDSSLIPAVSEPFFRNLDAEFELLPVMNQDELMTGLSKIG